MRTYEVTRRANELDEIEPTLAQSHGALVVDTIEADDHFYREGGITFTVGSNRQEVLWYNQDQVLFIEDVTETDPA